MIWDLAEGADEQIDLTNESSVNHAMARLVERFGRIDLLVNAAGITGPTVDIEHYSLRSGNACSTSTSPAPSSAARPPSVRSDGEMPDDRQPGLIAGKEGNAGMTGYSAAKAGVIALTKSLGKELAATEIRVNAIAPAVIATDLIKQMTDEAYRTVLAKIPLGRAGRPEEVAAMVAWLASDECSFSTGAVFDLSGGRATY